MRIFPLPPLLLTLPLRRGTVSIMDCLIRWRAQKLVKLGDEQVAQAQSLLKNRGVEIGPHDHAILEEHLEW